MKGKTGWLNGWPSKSKCASIVIAAVMVISGMAVMFLGATPANASSIISEDMEDISEWTQQSNGVTKTDYVAHSGTYSVHVNAQDDGSTYNAMTQSMSVSDVAMTIEYYIWYNQTTGKEQMTICGDGTSSDMGNSTGVNVNDSMQPLFNIKQNGAWGTPSYNDSITFPTKQWLHFTIVMDDGTAIWYNDTTEVATFDYTTGTTYSYAWVGLDGMTATTDYYVDDYTVKDTVETPTADPTHNESGDPITMSDFITWDGISISLKHDLMADTDNMSIVSDPDYEGGWSADGGGSIFVDGDTTYVSFRNRTNDTDRGDAWTIKSSTDLHSWTTEWSVDDDEVANWDALTLERVTIRKYNGTWYLYFCPHSSTSDIKVSYVSASTVSGLETQLLDANNWNDILTGGWKDPWVAYNNKTNEYWMMVGQIGEYDVELYKDDNPTFTSPTSTVIDSTLVDHNTGCIFYDYTSDKYIAWLSEKSGTYDNNPVYWYFYTSDNGDTWTQQETRNMGYCDWGPGNKRYMDYHAGSKHTNRIVMEYDVDSDEDNEMVLWDYTGIMQENYEPNVSNPIPNDGATDISLSPTICVNITDNNSDEVDVTFYDASDDSIIGTDTVNNGTASTTWYDLTYGTSYGWYVTASDGIANVTSDTWTFTTTLNVNRLPEISNPEPDNNSMGIVTNPTLSVYVTDVDNDTVSVYFYDASDDSIIGTDTVNNGTASTTWNDLLYETNYNWYVKANDGQEINTSEIWSFTTELGENTPGNDAPVLSTPEPTDGQEDVATDLPLSVDVTDYDGDAVTVSFYASNGTLIGTDTVTGGSGTATVNWTDLNHSTTYEWFTVGDDGTDTVTAGPWNFTTAAATVPPPAPTDYNALLKDPLGYMEANPWISLLILLILAGVVYLIYREAKG